MFCPGCGIQEDQPLQFCRACGTSFRPQVDPVTVSAMSAREEIGRAMADKIRELGSAKDLKKIAEDLLPQMEKFLESPAEKRLRRIRNGFIVSAVGLGAAIGFFIVAGATKSTEALFLAGAAIVTFLVGLALIINGYA